MKGLIFAFVMMAWGSLGLGASADEAGDVLVNYIPKGLEAFSEKFDELPGTASEKTGAIVTLTRQTIFQYALDHGKFEVAEFLFDKNNQAVSQRNAKKPSYAAMHEMISRRNIAALIFLIQQCKASFKMSEITSNFKKDRSKLLSDRALAALDVLGDDGDRNKIASTLINGRVEVKQSIASDLEALRQELEGKRRAPRLIQLLGAANNILGVVY